MAPRHSGRSRIGRLTTYHHLLLTKVAGTSKYLRARQVKLEMQLEVQGGGVPYTVVSSQ